jgi:hypothetical protein
MHKRNNYFQKNYKKYLLLFMRNGTCVSSSYLLSESAPQQRQWSAQDAPKMRQNGHQRAETLIMTHQFNRKARALIPTHIFQPIHARSRTTAMGKLRMPDHLRGNLVQPFNETARRMAG